VPEDNPTPKLHAHPIRRIGIEPIGSSPTAISTTAYAELHVSSNFSFLRGASHPDELVDAARAAGCHSIAITDLHSLAGVVRAHVAAKAIGLPLVVGTRIEVAWNGVTISLLLYPTCRESYGGLCKLLTAGKRAAPKGQCRLTLHDVVMHQAGVLCVVVPPVDDGHAVNLPRIMGESFVDLLAGLSRSFDDDRLSLAASRLYGPDDGAVLDLLSRISLHTGVPLVATNDVHYHTPARRALQDVLTCIRHGTTLNEAGPLLLPSSERFIKGPHEMRRLFASLPRAVDRSVAIADRALGFSLDQLRYEYPEEVCPPGLSPMLHLRQLVKEGIERESDGEPVRTLPANVEHELRLIEELGYAKYFLTCHDIVRFARSRGILCQGRGAAANSAVCFHLGITSVDPSRVDLLFERFVSKERNEPPDIDIDFEHERREEVIQYIYTKYGRNRAALVCEVISYRGRSAVREVGKAMGLSLDLVDRLAKQLDWWQSGPPRRESILEHGLDPDDPTIARVLHITAELLGFPRHLSQHVGGFVITQRPLDETCPIENARMADRTVIEWDKDDIDAMGMLKIDCLALGMLTAISRAFAMIDRWKGAQPASAAERALSLRSVPAEDPAVYEMFCKADTVGVFQIESRAQMSMLPRLRPRCWYDLVVEVAIVRPGPIQGDMVHPYLRRRQGLEPVTYPSRDVEHVLGKTLGVPLFQEQVMRLAVVGAGFSPGESDQLRRAMAAWKSKSNKLLAFRDRFIDGMTSRGYTLEFAERCFEQLKGFSGYGFPESHAASFAHIVYASGWIKHHHPAAFAAAIINSQPMGFYAPAQLVRDAREHGVEVRAVDVGASAWDCTLEAAHAGSPEPALRLGFRLIKGFQQPHADAIARANRSRGPFRDVTSLWRACDEFGGVPVAALRRLAQADAFLSMGLSRRQALWQVRGLSDVRLPLFEQAAADHDPPPAADIHPPTLRPSPESWAPLPVAPPHKEVLHDYIATGLSIKAHPISFLRDHLDRKRLVTADSLRDPSHTPHGRSVGVAGVVLCRQRPGTASGILFMTLEDETGVANLIIRPKVYEVYRKAARHSVCIAAWGRVERASGVTHLIAHRIIELSRLIERVESPMQTARNFR